MNSMQPWLPAHSVDHIGTLVCMSVGGSGGVHRHEDGRDTCWRLSGACNGLDMIMIYCIVLRRRGQRISKLTLNIKNLIKSI